MEVQFLIIEFSARYWFLSSVVIFSILLVVFFLLLYQKKILLYALLVKIIPIRNPFSDVHERGVMMSFG